MKDYISHLSRERVRFRHPIFRCDQVVLQAIDLLKDEPGIAGIKPGAGSILLLIEPEADVPGICSRLEERFPQLLAKKTCQKGALIPRKCLLRALLCTGVGTVALAWTGYGRWHAIIGSVFTVLGVNHVWTRRKAL